jgi:hypothetical protein
MPCQLFLWGQKQVQFLKFVVLFWVLVGKFRNRVFLSVIYHHWNVASVSVDHTRVKLKDVDPNVPGAEYINANYIKVHQCVLWFAACKETVPWLFTICCCRLSAGSLAVRCCHGWLSVILTEQRLLVVTELIFKYDSVILLCWLEMCFGCSE